MNLTLSELYPCLYSAHAGDKGGDAWLAWATQQSSPTTKAREVHAPPVSRDKQGKPDHSVGLHERRATARASARPDRVVQHRATGRQPPPPPDGMAGPTASGPDTSHHMEKQTGQSRRKPSPDAPPPKRHGMTATIKASGSQPRQARRGAAITPTDSQPGYSLSVLDDDLPLLTVPVRRDAPHDVPQNGTEVRHSSPRAHAAAAAPTARTAAATSPRRGSSTLSTTASSQAMQAPAPPGPTEQPLTRHHRRRGGRYSRARQSLGGAAPPAILTAGASPAQQHQGGLIRGLEGRAGAPGGSGSPLPLTLPARRRFKCPPRQSSSGKLLLLRPLAPPRFYAR
jgi:hypothetical protein